MADTFTTNVRARKMETGTRTGQWGEDANDDVFDVFDKAMGHDTVVLGSTSQTVTIADGSASAGGAFVVEFTGTPGGTTTVTLAPATLRKVWVFKNSTTDGSSVIISQGSGANVTIPNGLSAVVFTDGAGATAAVTSAFTHDTLIDFVANEHIDHSAVSIVAGDGLSGGGTIAADRTLNLDISGLTAPGGVPIDAADLMLFSDTGDSDTPKVATPEETLTSMFQIIRAQGAVTPESNDNLIYYDSVAFETRHQTFDTIPLTIFDDSSVGFTTHTASSLAFFGGTPVSQQTLPVVTNLTSISGTGDDADINANFSAIEARLNEIRTILANYNLAS